MNTNINYNSAAEAAERLYGMRAIAAYLGEELSKLQDRGSERWWRRHLDGGTMARIVKRSRSGPYPVTIGGETKYICGCGLSNTQPFCNGTHKSSRDEDPRKLYWYDEQGNRFETTDSFQGIRCPQE